MKDKFITNEGIEIPLHESAFTYVEENPRFKDSFWTNYTLPIDYHYTHDFLSKFGQYSSLNNKNLKRYHEGIHIFEGSPRKAKLEIMEFNKNSIKIQIDSGFETLPNFETKLEDLPLLDLKVNDIYDHANEIVSKKYPETNYNFPKLYTDKYNLEDEAYQYFDSMINNRTDLENTTGKAFPRNRIENDLDVYNKNIIHPLPYLLYVLKVGFKDAGFILDGEILEDKHLKQRLIWSSKEYHNTGEQKEHKLIVYHQEYTDMDGNTGRWEKFIKITAPGKYRLLVNGIDNSAQLLVKAKNITDIPIEQSHKAISTFSISENEAERGAVLTFNYSGIFKRNQNDSQGKSIGVAQIYITPIRQHTKAGTPIPYIFNENRVNLKKAVPKMTFGELVTTIKNLRNYDLEFKGNRAIMNTIKVIQNDGTQLEDFRQFEVENPTRLFNDKVNFNITFPENDAVEIKNIFFDENGYHINEKNTPKKTTEISINIFTLPMVLFRGAWTAKACDDTALMLVHYDGLNDYGDNHASNPPGLIDENLAKHLNPWFQNRLTNYVYKWTFITEKNKIRKYNIRSEIFCYGKRHQIKSWTKKSLSESLYSIEIETETY